MPYKFPRPFLQSIVRGILAGAIGITSPWPDSAAHAAPPDSNNPTGESMNSGSANGGPSGSTTEKNTPGSGGAVVPQDPLHSLPFPLSVTESIDIHSPRFKINSILYSPEDGKALLRITDMEHQIHIKGLAGEFRLTTYADCNAPTAPVTFADAKVDVVNLNGCVVHPASWFPTVKENFEQAKRAFPGILRQTLEESIVNQQTASTRKKYIYAGLTAVGGSLVAGSLAYRALLARSGGGMAFWGSVVGAVVVTVVTLVIAGITLREAYYDKNERTGPPSFDDGMISDYENVLSEQDRQLDSIHDKKNSAAAGLSYEEIRDSYFKAITNLPFPAPAGPPPPP